MVSQNEKAVARFRSSQVRTLTISIILLVAAASILTSIILNAAGDVIGGKVSSLVGAHSRQIQLNIDEYMERIEDAAMLMFSDEAYYLYDNTDESIEQYDRIQATDKIFARIVDIGIMQSFSDFMVLYSDGTSVGWKSKTTSELFSEGTDLYEYFAGCITDTRRNDGWEFDVNDIYTRFYYAKRLNPNAILLASSYSRELSEAFEHSEELRDMVVRLVDENEKIVYSTDTDEIGESLPEDISEYISGRTNISITNSEYFIEVNSCRNGWNVICSFGSDDLLREYNILKNIAITATAVICGIAIIISIVIQRRLLEPVSGIVTGMAKRATYDQLSGAINRASFVEVVKDAIKDNSSGEKYIFFAMTDIDNFKKVNDNLGHAYGDEVISRMSKLIVGLLGEKLTVGRMGGDEFAMFCLYENVSREDADAIIQNDISRIREEFKKEFSKEAQSLDVTLSMGVYTGYLTGSDTFDELYRKADIALYVSKENGKDRATIYDESMDEKGGDEA